MSPIREGCIKHRLVQPFLYSARLFPRCPPSFVNGGKAREREINHLSLENAVKWKNDVKIFFLVRLLFLCVEGEHAWLSLFR